MMEKRLEATIRISADEMEQFTAWVSGHESVGQPENREVLFDRSAHFADGFDADLSLRDDEGGPGWDVALYDPDGGFCAETEEFSDPLPLGEIAVFFVKGTAYAVTLERF